MPAAPDVNGITPPCVARQDGTARWRHRYRFGACIRCGQLSDAARADLGGATLAEPEAAPCDHADRRGWKCLLCGYDTWPARKASLLREYGVR